MSDDHKGICPVCGNYATTIMWRNIEDHVEKSCFKCYTNELKQRAAHGESILDRIRRLIGDKK